MIEMIKHNLTEENYYQDKDYFSNSMINAYLRCSAKEEALRLGDWKKPEGFNVNFAIGHYFESLLQGNSEEVIKSDEFQAMLCTKTGKPNAEAKKCEAMFEMCKNDPIFRKATTGEYEKILVGEIDGYEIKIKVDVLNVEGGFFTDIKTTKATLKRKLNESLNSFTASKSSLEWSDDKGKKLAFYDQWNYWQQLAIYQEIIRQNYGVLLQPFIAASSKVKPHLYDVYQVPKDSEGNFHERLQQELVSVSDNIQRIDAIMNGFETPKRCESTMCEYCMSTYKLEKPALMLPTEEII